MAAEKPEIEDTVRTAAIVHRLGMKIYTYVQWDTMMYETFFAEEPRRLSFRNRVRWPYADDRILFLNRPGVLETSQELAAVGGCCFLGGPRRHSNASLRPRFFSGQPGGTTQQATETHSSGELQQTSFVYRERRSEVRNAGWEASQRDQTLLGELRYLQPAKFPHARPRGGIYRSQAQYLLHDCCELVVSRNSIVRKNRSGR